ncbi:hypothetical protein QBC43DRAFT_321896 [Cladorrhinum sp. PSN259]|nr:hypothetical protein QBC43DRAFT_321896 [Cladorrhinum sp. PSN259]
MSGFEVAGIVLGSIPLLVSALEHYSEGVSTLRRWRKYERELQSLIRNLQTEHAKVKNVCEKLLYGLVPLSDLEAMIKDPFGHLWREDEVYRKICGRLWEASDVFEATVQDVKAALEEMTKRLESQKDGKVSGFLFTLKRSDYQDLLERIKTGVSDLENLTDRNIELEPVRRVRSQGKLLRILREVSRSLYRALRASLDCGCSHKIGIKLERRSLDIMPGDDDEKIIRELAFQLALSSQANVPKQQEHPAVAQAWHELVIKSAGCPRMQRTFTPTQCSLEPAKKTKPKKSVNFSFSNSTTTSTITTKTTTSTATTTVFQTKPDSQASLAQLTTAMTSFGLAGLEVTLRLCDKLQRAKDQTKETHSYGVIVDQDAGSTRRYSVHPLAIKGSTSWSIVSLQDILDHNDGIIQVPLSYRERLHLAVVISSGVLQLHDTPWLPESLNSGNIFFMSINGFPIYSHPLFLTEHGKNSNSNQSAEPVMDNLPFAFHRDARLLSLGCLLIELILGQTLVSLRGNQTNTSFPSGSQLADYVTAQSLLAKVKAESLNYWTAVRRCIEGEFHQRGCGLDNEQLCQDVYSGVVALLEKDFENS